MSLGQLISRSSDQCFGSNIFVAGLELWLRARDSSQQDSDPNKSAIVGFQTYSRFRIQSHRVPSDRSWYRNLSESRKPTTVKSLSYAMACEQKQEQVEQNQFNQVSGCHFTLKEHIVIKAVGIEPLSSFKIPKKTIASSQVDNLECIWSRMLMVQLRLVLYQSKLTQVSKCQHHGCMLAGTWARVRSVQTEFDKYWVASGVPASGSGAMFEVGTSTVYKL